MAGENWWARKKSVEQLKKEYGGNTGFKRSLGLWQLVGIGLGGIIGVGIFVLTGHVAATSAGPAVVISFLIAGIASGAAALCYAEFAGMIPVSGSVGTARKYARSSEASANGLVREQIPTSMPSGVRCP